MKQTEKSLALLLFFAMTLFSSCTTARNPYAKYFKDLPHINVMKIVNFLLKPAGNYETPIVGSFSSNSGNGSEKVTYNGTLKLFGNQMKKYD